MLFPIAENKQHNFIFLSVIAVFVGGLIYLFLRPVEPLFFEWIKWAGYESHISHFRQFTLRVYPVLPGWIVYSLPNGLWAFSYSLLIFCYWRKSTSRIKFFWIGTIPLVVFGFELLQFIGLLSGTFCEQDVFFLFAGMIGGITISLNNYKKNCNEKKSV
jgi:hypothetical protein